MCLLGCSLVLFLGDKMIKDFTYTLFVVALFVTAIILSEGCVSTKNVLKSPKEEIRADKCAILAEKGSLSEARAACQTCLAFNHKDSECLNAYGTVVYNRSPDEAIRLFKDAIKYDKSNYRAYNNLGAVLSRRGEHEKAFEFFEKAIKAKPDYFDGLYNYAHVLTHVAGKNKDKKKLDKALDLLNRARLVSGDREVSRLDGLENSISIYRNLLNR